MRNLLDDGGKGYLSASRPLAISREAREKPQAVLARNSCSRPLSVILRPNADFFLGRLSGLPK
jgi:hypothetical protein